MASSRPSPTFYEFFAGGGMARAALTGSGWHCLFANDFDAKKVATYGENWGYGEIVHGDVGKLCSSQLPGGPDLVWASFPCQDLSLAGGGAGLKGNRSGTFWPFWRIVRNLIEENRKPRIVALENVCGTLSSHGGKDFEAICDALSKENYFVGAVVIDAALFVPQSRPRLFVVGIDRDAGIPLECTSDVPVAPWHSRALVAAHEKLPPSVRRNWVWWKLPPPAKRTSVFSDLVEAVPASSWHSLSETQKLLDMMTPLNRKKVEDARRSNRRMVGAIYRRTRQEASGRVQRAEVQFDDIAGCLRTPAGGSSRQILLFVDGNDTRTRLISARETARLMGLSDSYKLPERYNEAYHLTGDGVAVPVVRFLSETLLHRLLPRPSERLVA